MFGWLFDWILIDFWSIWESKIHADSLENRSRRPSETRCKLGWSLDCSWIDFGLILEVKLEPSWHQNRSKMASKSMSKHVQKNDRKFGLQGHARACGQTQQIWLLAPKKLFNPWPREPYKALETLHYVLEARWRKATEQQINQAMQQQSNKPINQQTNKQTSQKWIGKWSPNYSKIDPQS